MDILSHDAAFLRSAAEVLEDYLLSDVLFWPLQREKGTMLGGDSDQLTPGNLLLSRARLGDAASADPSLAGALKQIEKIRREWKSAWLNKCEKEWNQRMRLWVRYLDELKRESSPILPADFAFHVRQRVILHLLGLEMSVLPPEKQTMLQNADDLLRSISQAGEFIWQKNLQGHFPVSTFWYLYLKTGKEKTDE